MPSTPRAKATKTQRGRAAVEHGVSDDAVFGYLVRSFQRERKPGRKWEKGMALLPYLRPRLRAVEVKGSVEHEISLTIGGMDD